MHFPSEQISGDGHLLSLPHLHCRAVHVSAASDASEQSSLVLHSSVIRVCYSYLYIPVTLYILIEYDIMMFLQGAHIPHAFGHEVCISLSSLQIEASEGQLEEISSHLQTLHV